MQSFQEQDYTKRFDLSLWRKLIKVAKPYHKNLIAVVLFMAVSAIIDVIMPNMNAYAIDVFIANHSTAGLVGFVVAYALLTAVQVATIFGFLRQCGIVETGTCYLIRKLGFQKLQELPFSYYDRMPVGYLMSRLTNDTQRLADTIGWSLVVAGGLVLGRGVSGCLRRADADHQLAAGADCHAGAAAAGRHQLEVPEGDSRGVSSGAQEQQPDYRGLQ